MATVWLEMTFGVFLVLFSVAMVILFIFLCEQLYIIKIMYVYTYILVKWLH